MSVKKRPNGRWQARVIGPDRKSHTRIFDRKIDADNWVSTQKTDTLRGDWVDPRAGRKLFSAYASEWQAHQRHRPATKSLVAIHLKNHILPTFGDRPLGSIRHTEIKSWVTDRGDDLAPATVELVFRYLSTIFKAAVTDQLLARSPCVGIKLPAIEREKVIPLADEHVNKLIAEAPPRFRALIVMAAETGLREGELLGLTSDHVNMLGRRLEVTQQMVTVNDGSPPRLGPPKTKAGRRTVPLPDGALAALAAHMASFPPGEQKLIFTSGRGTPVRRNTFNQMWRRTAKRAGLEGVKFHSLRHYYASILIDGGESVKVVQARLGHASAMETLDTYGHLWPDSEDRTRGVVDARRRSAAPSSARILREHEA